MALVAFDNTILSILLFPDADLREGATGVQVDRARERVEGLVEELAQTGEQVLIPSPAREQWCSIRTTSPLRNAGLARLVRYKGHLNRVVSRRLGDLHSPEMRPIFLRVPLDCMASAV